VAQLFRTVHRIHRHYDRIGTQDRVVGDYELRAVLRVEEHAVAARDAEALLQKAGEHVDLTLQLRVGDSASVVIDGRALGRPGGGRDQVAVNGLARQLQGFRLAGRPMREVPRKHHTW
jgi:hypothetical protein